MTLLVAAKAQERMAAINKVPEHMVEEMQALNKKMEETEAAIEEYFKSIDKEAETIMKIQLDGEEKMMKAMQQQALLGKAEAEKTAGSHKVDGSQSKQNNSSIKTSKDTRDKIIFYTNDMN